MIAMWYHLEKPTVFVDHQAQKRSGHMGHAMVEYEPDYILDFYSNCDYDRANGHSGYGWMEYKRSLDGGQTWGPARRLPYSRRLYEEGIHTALCEKAVVTDTGAIVCFFQITDASKPMSCEPWSEPTYIVSRDKGETWSEARKACPVKGRIYDAVYRDGEILFIIQANDAANIFLGNLPEHHYELYCSDDDGRSFQLRSVIPIDAMGKGYGALEFTEDGKLMACVYDSVDEFHMPYCLSADRGKTWPDAGAAPVAKRIRNPQIVRTESGWLLHGRNGDKGDGLVLYASPDGVHWDEGVMVDVRPCPGVGYYSNNLYLRGRKKVLIQYSHVYDKNRVNIMHVWVNID
ncbi:MAG: exo-alpha-sialidase [Clostridia bacterium]|nr:exo-alpha-sialidase [Clostridia bacterium]